MSDFKTRYNYQILIARFFALLLFVAITVFYVFDGFPIIIESHKTNIAMYISLFLGLLTFLIVIFRFVKVLVTQRFDLTVTSSFIDTRDIFLSKNTRISKEQIKGFSQTIYSSKYNTPSILLYLNDGTKMEFPQFLYKNFNQLKDELQKHNYNYFGTEPLRWKSFYSRQYTFD